MTHTATTDERVEWTTGNLGEAMPGVCTPLSWTHFEHGVEWGMRHGFLDLGALRRSELAATGDRMALLNANVDESAGPAGSSTET